MSASFASLITLLLFQCTLFDIGLIHGSPVINLDVGLIAYYPFNGNASDHTSNHNDGIVNGPILTQDRFGKADSAYYFDLWDYNFINISSIAPLISNLRQISISVWVEPYSYQEQYPYILSTNRPNEVYISGQGSWYGDGYRKVKNRFAGDCEIVTDYVDENEWTHLVVMFDGIQNKSYMYQNNVLVSEDNDCTAREMRSLDTYSIVGIGINADRMSGGYQYGNCWHGKIDDIIIYDRILNEQEINALFYAESTFNIYDYVQHQNLTTIYPDPSIYTTSLSPTSDPMTQSPTTSPSSAPVTTTPTAQPSTSPLSIGLVAYYPFNGNASDHTSNQNHGRVNKAVLTEDRFGEADSAYYFALWDWNYIDISGVAPLISNLEQISISVWIEPYSFREQYPYIFSTDSPNSVYIQGQGTWYGDGYRKIRNRFNSDCELLTNYIDESKWTHLVVMYDGIQNTSYIYENNVLVSEDDSCDAGGLGRLDTQSIVGIGIRADRIVETGHQYGNCWHGKIDDILIYNRILDEDEINELFYANDTIIIEDHITTSATPTAYSVTGNPNKSPVIYSSISPSAASVSLAPSTSPVYGQNGMHPSSILEDPSRNQPDDNASSSSLLVALVVIAVIITILLVIGIIFLYKVYDKKKMQTDNESKIIDQKAKINTGNIELNPITTNGNDMMPTDDAAPSAPEPITVSSEQPLEEQQEGVTNVTYN